MARAASSVLLLALCMAISTVSPVLSFSVPFQPLPRSVQNHRLWSACDPSPKLNSDLKGSDAHDWLSAPAALVRKIAVPTVLAFALLSTAGDSPVVAAPLSEIDGGSGGMLLAEVAPKYLSKPLGKHWDGGGSDYGGRDWFEEHPTHGNKPCLVATQHVTCHLCKANLPLPRVGPSCAFQIWLQHTTLAPVIVTWQTTHI